ncbi:MAG: ABC transporter ATP-binding protein [Defluviitaleaceae bacterium]|nr:ABC transporter ATP-binding protein [Defluviitaleaceae bacterium]
MLLTKNLTKTFDGVKAIDGLDMNIPKGSIYGLVGVNGSGKTTVIKHIAGVLKADAGHVTLDGSNTYDNPSVKAQIGYVADDLYFFPQYNLKKLGQFYSNMYKSWNTQRFTQLISLLELDPKRNVGRFSKGMQKQAALALALSIMPQLLLLDEPIDGLDPIVRKRIFQWIIEDVADRQTTVLISSHNLKEMDGICDTVGIIKQGRMLMEKDLDQLKAQMATEIAGEHTPPTLDEIFVSIYEHGGLPSAAPQGKDGTKNG